MYIVDNVTTHWFQILKSNKNFLNGAITANKLVHICLPNSFLQSLVSICLVLLEVMIKKWSVNNNDGCMEDKCKVMAIAIMALWVRWAKKIYHMDVSFTNFLTVKTNPCLH